MNLLIIISLLFIQSNINLNLVFDKKSIHAIGFYNVENLFDLEDDPNLLNDEKLPFSDKRWTNQVYTEKIDNLSRVISEIGFDETNSLPTIVGLCEVENKDVVKDIVESKHLKFGNYGISHFDSPDERGIDVALIYRKEFFKITKEKNILLEIYDSENKKRDYTRDQLLVEGELQGEKIYFIVNHWPSRFGGELKSRPSRNEAARLNKYIIDSLKNISQESKIITMGDFNDDPINESLNVILQAKGNKDLLKNLDLYNPYYKKFIMGEGTLKYRGKWNLFDQIIITKSLLDKKSEGFYFLSANIYNKQYLINQDGNYKGYPFRSFAGGNFIKGFSDHLPIYILLGRKQRKQ